MQIQTKAELKALAKKLEVRKDWHEPDEQGLEARVYGEHFDNAGFWGSTEINRQYGKNLGTEYQIYLKNMEQWVTLFKNGEAIAEINLATLFAFACDTYDGD